MPIIAKRQKREIPPENVYKAKIENIELENHEDYGERVRFDFDLHIGKETSESKDNVAF